MVKKWIRGNKERGSEVIKALEDLGGINNCHFDGTEETVVYYIHPFTNNICAVPISWGEAAFILWVGEEIILEKPCPISCNNCPVNDACSKLDEARDYCLKKDKRFPSTAVTLKAAKNHAKLSIKSDVAESSFIAGVKWLESVLSY